MKDKGTNALIAVYNFLCVTGFVTSSILDRTYLLSQEFLFDLGIVILLLVGTIWLFNDKKWARIVLMVLYILQIPRFSTDSLKLGYYIGFEFNQWINLLLKDGSTVHIGVNIPPLIFCVILVAQSFKKRKIV